MADPIDPAPLHVLADFLRDQGALDLLTATRDPVRELLELREEVERLRARPTLTFGDGGQVVVVDPGYPAGRLLIVSNTADPHHHKEMFYPSPWVMGPNPYGAFAEAEPAAPPSPHTEDDLCRHRRIRPATTGKGRSPFAFTCIDCSARLNAREARDAARRASRR